MGRDNARSTSECLVTDSSPADPAKAEPPAALAAGGGRNEEAIAPDAPPAPPSRLWDRMREDPQYAPEHLALEAVRRLGPEARVWADRARARHPEASPADLAAVATKRFVNHARLSGAVSGAAGLPGAAVDVGVLAWTQARMVLHVAAAYGYDPTHRDRAAELLVLQRVHKVAETARLALGVAAGRERAATLFTRTDNPLPRAALRLAVQLAKMAGVRAARRAVAKVVPGAAVVFGSWANSSATSDLAQRAEALYRPRAIPAPRRP